MISIALLLVLAAFVVCIASAMGRAPLWPAVVLLVIIALFSLLPAR